MLQNKSDEPRDPVLSSKSKVNGKANKNLTIKQRKNNYMFNWHIKTVNVKHQQSGRLS